MWNQWSAGPPPMPPPSASVNPQPPIIGPVQPAQPVVAAPPPSGPVPPTLSGLAPPTPSAAPAMQPGTYSSSAAPSYTPAQYAAMTPEQQYAVQQHWQQWQAYEQQYAQWHAQYGEQYKREMAAIQGAPPQAVVPYGASSINSSYAYPPPVLSNAYQVPPAPANVPPPPPPDDNISSKGIKAPAQIYEQPPPPPPPPQQEGSQPPLQPQGAPNFQAQNAPPPNFLQNQENKWSQPPPFSTQQSSNQQDRPPQNQYNQQQQPPFNPNQFHQQDRQQQNQYNQQDRLQQNQYNQQDLQQQNQFNQQQNQFNQQDRQQQNQFNNNNNQRGRQNQRDQQRDGQGRNNRQGNRQNNNNFRGGNRSRSANNYENDNQFNDSDGRNNYQQQSWQQSDNSGDRNSRGNNSSNRFDNSYDNSYDNFNPNLGQNNNQQRLNNWNDNNQGNNFRSPEVRREPPNNQNQNQNQNQSTPNESIQRPARSASVDEKAFDEQFRMWEEQFENWKKENANHPDRTMYMQYEKEFEKTRVRLLERREQMKRRKMLELQQSMPSAETQMSVAAQQLQPLQTNLPQQEQGDIQPQPPQELLQPQPPQHPPIENLNQEADNNSKPSDKPIETEKEAEMPDEKQGEGSDMEQSDPEISDSVSNKNSINPSEKSSKEIEENDLNRSDETNIFQKQEITALFQSGGGIPGLDLVSSKDGDAPDNANEQETNLKTIDLDNDGPSRPPKVSAASNICAGGLFSSNTQSQFNPSLPLIDSRPKPLFTASQPQNSQPPKRKIPSLFDIVVEKPDLSLDKEQIDVSPLVSSSSPAGSKSKSDIVPPLVDSHARSISKDRDLLPSPGLRPLSQRSTEQSFQEPIPEQQPSNLPPQTGDLAKALQDPNVMQLLSVALAQAQKTGGINPANPQQNQLLQQLQQLQPLLQMQQDRNINNQPRDITPSQQTQQWQNQNFNNRFNTNMNQNRNFNNRFNTNMNQDRDSFDCNTFNRNDDQMKFSRGPGSSNDGDGDGNGIGDMQQKNPRNPFRRGGGASDDNNMGNRNVGRDADKLLGGPAPFANINNNPFGGPINPLQHKGGNFGRDNFDGNNFDGNNFRGGDSRGGNFSGDSRGANFGGDLRGGNFGGDSRGGNLGGDYRGGNFGGDSRGGNFGGDSRGGNFGGDSRGGNFGGDSRGGNFGGDSRAGNFGGDSGGGNFGGGNFGGGNNFGQGNLGGNKEEGNFGRGNFGRGNFGGRNNFGGDNAVGGNCDDDDFTKDDCDEPNSAGGGNFDNSRPDSNFGNSLAFRNNQNKFDDRGGGGKDNDYYRPAQIFDYQNRSRPEGLMPQAKVVDYGHKPSALLPPNSFNRENSEFVPIKTIDYGHAKPENQIQDKNVNQTIKKKVNRWNQQNTNQNEINPPQGQQQQQRSQTEGSRANKFGNVSVVQTNQQQNKNFNENKSEELTKSNEIDELESENLEEYPKNRWILQNPESRQRPGPPTKRGRRNPFQSDPQPIKNVSQTEENECDEIEENFEEISDNECMANDTNIPKGNTQIKEKLKSLFPSVSDSNKAPSMIIPSNENNNTIPIDEILFKPGRLTRPKNIVIIIRGPPGSGKSHVAKLIKDKEVEMGGQTPRLLSVDDYFMVENDYDEKCPKTGRKIPKKEILYEYEKAMEPTYMQYLIKSFKKTVTDHLYDFIIVDCCNQSLRTFNEFYNAARDGNFSPFVIDLKCDLETCLEQNIHNRKEEDIKEIIKNYQDCPGHYIKLDVANLLENVVEMEDVSDLEDHFAADSEVINLDEDEAEEDEGSDNNDGGSLKSKWDTDPTTENLARLDGTSKPISKRGTATLEEYLQIDGWEPIASNSNGKKRVRWADIEEKRAQDKMRAIGFVVGQTDWNRMMDPTSGSGALTKTKYIERSNKRR